MAYHKGQRVEYVDHYFGKEYRDFGTVVGMSFYPGINPYWTVHVNFDFGNDSPYAFDEMELDQISPL